MNPKKYFNPANYVKKAVSLFAELYAQTAAKILFNANSIHNDEKIKFLKAGLNYDVGLEKLNDILSGEFKKTYSPEQDSIHWLVAACLESEPVKRILEIGTYQGEFTRILSCLFPQAEIVTIDLPKTDPLLKKLYSRGSEQELRAFREIQKRNIDKPNIKLLETNSLFLMQHVKGAFDIVWVDGGHLYPEVAWDLANGFNLLSEEGVLMCDDVIPLNRKYSKGYVSTESYEVLRYLEDRIPEKVEYFLKRLDGVAYAQKATRKYVAFIKKSIGK